MYWNLVKKSKDLITVIYQKIEAKKPINKRKCWIKLFETNFGFGPKNLSNLIQIDFYL